MLIGAQLSGDQRCAALGMTARGFAPVLALCGLLVAAGHNPKTPLHVSGKTEAHVRAVTAGLHPARHLSWRRAFFCFTAALGVRGFPLIGVGRRVEQPGFHDPEHALVLSDLAIKIADFTDVIRIIFAAKAEHRAAISMTRRLPCGWCCSSSGCRACRSEEEH